LITYLIDSNSSNWFNGYKVGFELIIINGLFTYIGLWLISKDQTTQPAIVNS
jgi:hypothetical protein